jgi:hypothetical protein
LFSKDIVSDAEDAPEVKKVASGFGRFTGDFVEIVRAMPLLGGGTRLQRPWRCCVAGLLSCGHSFTESLKFFVYASSKKKFLVCSAVMRPKCERLRLRGEAIGGELSGNERVNPVSTVWGR